jgi:hypothetical protein
MSASTFSTVNPTTGAEIEAFICECANRGSRTCKEDPLLRADRHPGGGMVPGRTAQLGTPRPLAGL